MNMNYLPQHVAVTMLLCFVSPLAYCYAYLVTWILIVYYAKSGYVTTVVNSYNKPEIPCQTVSYKQELVVSEQFPMRYSSTWLRSLLCYIKKFVVIRVFHCIIFLIVTFVTSTLVFALFLSIYFRSGHVKPTLT